VVGSGPNGRSSIEYSRDSVTPCDRRNLSPLPATFREHPSAGEFVAGGVKEMSVEEDDLAGAFNLTEFIKPCVRLKSVR